MIINTGSRTDIPAYYSKWFYNRIKEGYVCVRNPYYPTQVTRFQLSPKVVDLICFCTKNPEPMLERLDEMDEFSQFWFVTITPYGKDIEPNVPQKQKVMDSFCRLSEKVGAPAISWRYDPIFISDKYTMEFHISEFESMAKTLAGYTDQCVISFIDLYQKTKRNFPGVSEVTKAQQELLTQEFVRIGTKYGMTIRTCCEMSSLRQFGADVSGCMTQAVLERALGSTLTIPKGGKPAREQCNCLLGNDIGMYNTCGHACLYCYANYNQKMVDDNMRKHHVDSPFLIGGYQEGDIIKEAKQEAYRTGQLKLFDF